MKTAIMFLVLLPMLTACKRQNDAVLAHSDAELARKMVGTWSSDNFGAHSKATLTVEPSGHYTCDIETVGSNGVRRVELEGVQHFTNGILVDTVTRDSQTNAAPVPRTFRAQILRVEDGELVFRYEGTDRDALFRRQK